MDFEEIYFTRSSVARILLCTPLTVANREKSGRYPEPRRGEDNKYRYYTLLDIFALQEITHDQIYFKQILVELYDKGYQDPVKVNAILTAARDTYSRSKQGEVHE